MWTVIALSAVGGLVNHLIINERNVIGPRRLAEGGVSTGFVGDLFLGLVAGFLTWLSLRVDLPRDKELVSATLAAIAFPSFFEAIVGPTLERQRGKILDEQMGPEPRA